MYPLAKPYHLCTMPNLKIKTLTLTLNKKWFYLIKSGIKTEEYREIKPYWINRLTWHEFHWLEPEEIIKEAENKIPIFRKDFDIISANNGYAKECPNIKWQHKGIRIGTGNPKWGAEPGKQYFILEIGELL